MAADDLTVHDLVVSQQTRLAGGKAYPVTHVSYYVGTHGPFTQDFQAPGNTPALIQAAIQQQVNDLRAITQREY